MAKLTESQRKQLLSNPNVLKIDESNITFTVEFKIKAAKASLAGEKPADIFKSAKIDLSSFRADYAKGTIRRWRETFEKSGPEGFEKESRGKGAVGRPKKLQFKSMEEELEYLRMEVYLLKKLRALAELEHKKGSK
tara:strand:- start:343 stop:750 length:408 start_codon:yes stop_codon:yes gene_type:complete